MTLRALCFDIDGTLCAYGLPPHQALEGACREHGVDAAPDPADYYALYKVVARERPRAGYRAVSDEAYRRLLARQGWDDADLAGRVAAAYRRSRLDSIQLYPETLEVLEALQGRVALGVISNGPGEIQWAKLEKFDLKRHFDAVVISGDVGVEKPEESIFRLALERLGAAARESAHVGDDPEADVLGAVEAGLTAFWVNRGVLPFEGVEARPHYEVADLRGVLDRLDTTPR